LPKRDGGYLWSCVLHATGHFSYVIAPSGAFWERL
jgi:hypothetical protein